jgi:hypothetical protein
MPTPTLSVKKKAGSRLVRKQNNNTIGLGVAHEEARQELADAAAEALRRKEMQEVLEKITVGKPSCPKPVIGTSPLHAIARSSLNMLTTAAWR